ncbi:DUF2642 domain-containing protein [Salibacterium qingdaonense]|uniref:DUF2642 domain-containing protein n=1 Tax=Salibacterium qingdaonense TaxID=266892 RepID=A0A1I4MDZ1_9BACI|nr:DUF2642 domain-containing protein [Salibacterium qingdaonense]SFM01524.1 Protein of unknown function [Salibacterium qingdaonense]
MARVNASASANIEQLVNQLSNVSASIGGGTSSNNDTPPTTACSPNTPGTLWEVLCSLVGEQIEVTTPFGVVDGTLLSVQSDYIVLVDDTGSQVLVRYGNIETVNEL